MRTKRASDSGSNFRANLSYKPSEDACSMRVGRRAFASAACRPGSPLGSMRLEDDNIVDGTDISIASTGDRSISDEIDSYELGSQARPARQSRDDFGGVFRMRWSKMPVRVTPVPVEVRGTLRRPQLLRQRGRGDLEGVEFDGRCSDQCSAARVPRRFLDAMRHWTRPSRG